MNKEIYNQHKVAISYENETAIFQMKIGKTNYTFSHDEMVKIVCAVGDKILDLHREPVVGDHVKILGNAPGTAWETGCIEHVDGCMAYIIYGVKTLGEFGGIRGMGMPVPLSMLKRID